MLELDLFVEGTMRFQVNLDLGYGVGYGVGLAAQDHFVYIFVRVRILARLECMVAMVGQRAWTAVAFVGDVGHFGGAMARKCSVRISWQVLPGNGLQGSKK